MAIHYRSQGIILKKSDRGEADQLLTIYTKDFGKVHILGKAIRKMKSKLRSGAENLYLSEVEFIQGKAQKTLTDAILIDKFVHLRKDLAKLKTAYQISDIFDGLIKGQERDEYIWNLLVAAFKELNNPQFPAQKQQLLFFYVAWNLLSLLGYKPELHRCSFCQKKLIPQNLYFHFQQGGVICQSCFQRVKEGERISPEIIKIIRLILEKKW